MTRDQILKTLKDENVRFLRLQFSDIFGINKNVEVPYSQFEKALDGEIMFDGSSIEGFSRIEESDQLLVPDYETFRVLPWENAQGKIARIICDIKNPDGSAFEGCVRTTLKRVCDKAAKMGYNMQAGPEAEFFLFLLNEDGVATNVTHDSAGYFDLAPIDLGEEARQEMVNVLQLMGFEVEAAHHEVAEGQHEIDFKYDDALKTADNVSTFKYVVRRVAHDYGLHATFMPKPIFGINGSGMHTHMSLFKGEENAFFDPNADYQLSEVARQYIAGLLKHAKSYVAITNPLVNSYKRLVPGYEAPINVAWSEHNRSPMIRVPAKRGKSTRVEVRMPDPSCNPYLAFAVMLAAGLDGIENKLVSPPPVNKNIFAMSQREKRRLKIEPLPSNMLKAVEQFEKSKLMRETLGDHIYFHFINAKKQEWSSYISQVHQWELERYLSYY
ncbi:MAG TPA: type I glutamate--ammonia ligase [Caldithrix abyssi]|uniref:Glutamine synthetase n=1 Tax=Caldithrix abyssi TaxID=187145 RepID=A0A7V4WUZ1_CALAY|nr:type I glutamate--ammonia ligase [Caldithrix abyssi]